MQFKISDLKFFLSSLKKYKINKIKIQDDHLKMVINTTKINQHVTHNNQLNLNNIHNKQQPKLIKKTNINQSDLLVKNNRKFMIKSPMIGTFYRSPAPSEPSFVKLNEMVHVNQTVCIIEAMKLMNEIKSEVNGSIADILVEDGKIVEYGQPLMIIDIESKH